MDEWAAPDRDLVRYDRAKEPRRYGPLALTRAQRRHRFKHRVPLPMSGTHGHPAVRKMFEEMYYQGVTYAEMERDAGVPWQTLTSWRRGVWPRTAYLEACLNVVHLRLIAVPIDTPDARAVYSRGETCVRSQMLRLILGFGDVEFTAEDIACEWAERGSVKQPSTVRSYLTHYVRTGVIERVRRGTYRVIPEGGA